MHERQYKAHGKRMKGNPFVMISVRIDNELKNFLSEKAKEKYSTLSYVLRDLIRSAMQERSARSIK